MIKPLISKTTDKTLRHYKPFILATDFYFKFFNPCKVHLSRKSHDYPLDFQHYYTNFKSRNTSNKAYYYLKNTTMAIKVFFD